MNYSTTSSQSNNDTLKKGFFYQNLTYGQFIGIILAGSAILVSITVLLFLIIYQKYRLRVNKLNNLGLTSNNPCYVGSSMSQFDGGSSHAHCNLSVSRDFYDIDDLTSLDNDSFLNSLENAIFVGYLNHSRISYNADDRFSQSTVHSNQPAKVQVAQTSLVQNSSRHSYKKSAPSRYSTAHSSVKLRNGRIKASTGNTNTSSNHDSMRIRAKSETISESIGSTSNLITSSKMFLDDSNDSFCESGKSIQQLTETIAIASRDSNPDVKTESSTDSHASVNSSCAMMSGFLADTSSTGQTALPDIVNSSLPRSTKTPKHASRTYSNSLNYDDTTISSTGQILDPLRAGQTMQISTNQTVHTHERHKSYNSALFDYPISSS